MKAIRVREFGGPESLRLEDVEDPPPPGPGQVLVSVRAAGVNPVDVYVRSGEYAWQPPLPYTPGSDAGGVVEAVGEGVRRLAPGDRVYVLGTAAGRHAGACAERALCEESQVHRIPTEITFSQAGAIGVPYATAWRALFQRARGVAGERVLIHGASGGVGTAAVQIARAHGFDVWGTAGTDEGRTLVRDQGAHHVLDHRAPSYLDGLRFDVILEMAAHVNLGRDLAALAAGGRVVVIGTRGPVEVNPRLLMGADGAVLGMGLWNATPAEIASIHAGLEAGLATGTLRPVIGREMPLSQAPRAHELVMEPGSYGKIVLVP